MSATVAAPGRTPETAVARGFVTRDPDEARARSIDLLQCQHRMRVDESIPFGASVAHRRLGAIGLFDSRYASRVTINCEPFIPFFTVNLVNDGRAVVVRDGGGTTLVKPGTGAVIDYRRPMAITYERGVRTRMLTLSKSRVTSFLEGLLGAPIDEPLVFSGGIDVAARAQRLVGTLATFDRITDQHAHTTPSPAVVAEVEHAFLSSLLLDHEHNYSDRLFAPSRPAGRSVLDSVIEFIDAALDEPLTVADLAAHANVSERTLFATFQRELGVAPMTYLRRRRLERVRAFLTGADAPGEFGERPTIAQLAYRFGFTHPGRFAKAYRELYGETPSQTVERLH